MRFIDNDLEAENETFRMEINDSLSISVAASKIREDFHTLFKVKKKKQSPLDGVEVKPPHYLYHSLKYCHSYLESLSFNPTFLATLGYPKYNEPSIQEQLPS